MTVPWGKRAVTRSPDFERIKNLAVRPPRNTDELVREMNECVKVPGSLKSLRPVQAEALLELLTNKGGFFPIGVGNGKTLIFMMAAVIMNLKRPLGLLPASLIEKTERERAEYARDFRIDRTMLLKSYEMLGRESAQNLIEVMMPDGIITDESHKLKNPDASCTRRVARWMRENPDTRFVAMSGTLIKNSIKNFAHLLRWSLGPDKAPVPRTEGELQEWADCLDERVQPMQRVRPGVLVELAPHVTGDSELSRARRAFQHRLMTTPGVVCSLDAERVDCSLYIEGTTYDVNDTTDENFETLRSRWETPDGWALSEAVDVWRHARELALGFHYVWDPRPPDDWLEARRTWAKFVRDTLAKSRSLDSEGQVQTACMRGELDDTAFRAWEKIRDTFVINQKAVWHDESALDLCAAWLKKEKGICWVEHTFFGRELARRAGLSYYGQNGLDDKGRSILDAKGPIVASIAANGTGKNLQAWNKNLIASCPTGASILEQLIGRTHRPGQMADEVKVDILIGCIEHVEAWARARAEAKMSEDLFGQAQKILIADVVNIPSPDSVDEYGARWTKTAKESDD